MKRFDNWNHIFHKLGLTEQLNIISNISEVLKQRVKDRENYWIKKIKALTPFSLNQELN